MMSAWDVIYRPIRERLPAQFCDSGCALARVETNAVDVTAILADGSRVTDDLLIAADVANSDSVRSAEVLPQPPSRRTLRRHQLP
jgi:2-polyprenyl-6-methoxyphenol hydroxylase-like FAD-dependent oxidoreductase